MELIALGPTDFRVHPSPDSVLFACFTPFSFFIQAKYRSLMEEGLVPDRGVSTEILG